jgi:hypothetical protein
MGSWGATDGGSAPKLKRGGEMIVGGGNRWVCGVINWATWISRLAQDGGEGEGRRWKVKENQVD